MIRSTITTLCILAAVLSAAAEPLRPSSVADQGTVDALAATYTFSMTDQPLVGCIVELKATPVQAKGRFGRPVKINEQCTDRFPFLAQVTRWEPTGGGSIRLLGGKPFQEISDFAPVQDASGVYLRGSFPDDKSTYELRPPQ